MFIEQGVGVCVEASDNCRISEALGSLENEDLVQRLYDLYIFHNSVPAIATAVAWEFGRNRSTPFPVRATPSTMGPI
ncbi:MAG: hypothetical protein IMY84_03225 [Chloroflexi bacterium]|nr:hypothetical protein [Chloroflexota bacterium]